MNAQLKTILLTILTLSCFVIALVELSGVSSTALYNKYGIGQGGSKSSVSKKEEEERLQQAAAMPKTNLLLMDTLHDFGTIKEGTLARHSFHFKNTGSNPLLIIKAQASCGCTVPSFPKQPIAPGGEGDIQVEFDSHHRKGRQHKNVMIFSNATQERMSVGFDAEVE